MLFTLDLKSGSYDSISTSSGLFDGQPDQIKHLKHVVGAAEGKQEIMYFTEDDRSSGIHARNLKNGKFFTIAHSLSHKSETTAIAFSRDEHHLRFCLHDPGVCFDVTREDGKSFSDKTLEIIYS